MPAEHPQVIEALNEVLAGELTSINQYFVHAEMCTHWGYKGLGATIRQHSIEEMRHAESLIERVLTLDGIPSMQKLNKISLGESVPEIFTADLGLEKIAVPCLNQGIRICQDAPDHTSRILLESILKSEEEHVEWLGEQLGLIEQLGVENYLTTQVAGAPA